MSTPVDVSLRLDLESLEKLDVKYRKGQFFLYVPVTYQAAKDFSEAVRKAIQEAE
jgi:hypothetical protein